MKDNASLRVGDKVLSLLRVIYRCCVAVYFGYLSYRSLILYNITVYEFFMYLTFVGVFFGFIYMMWAFTSDAMKLVLDYEHFSNSYLPPMIHSFGDVALTLQYVIIPFYWIIVHDPKIPVQMGLQLHALTGILLMLDLVIFRHRYRSRISIFLVCFTAIWIVAHATYVVIVDEPIYPNLTFKNAYSYIVTAAAVVTLLIGHFVAYLISNYAADTIGAKINKKHDELSLAQDLNGNAELTMNAV